MLICVFTLFITVKKKNPHCEVQTWDQISTLHSALLLNWPAGFGLFPDQRSSTLFREPQLNVTLTSQDPLKFKVGGGD